jgi:hypothetical protein
MKTSGHGNDALMMLVPAGVLMGVSVVMAGGPAEALKAMNTIVGDIATVVITFVRSLL